MRVIGMTAWCRDSLAHEFRSWNGGPRASFTKSNITGEGCRTLKGVNALATIKQLARQV